MRAEDDDEDARDGEVAGAKGFVVASWILLVTNQMIPPIRIVGSNVTARTKMRRFRPARWTAIGMGPISGGVITREKIRLRRCTRAAVPQYSHVTVSESSTTWTRAPQFGQVTKIARTGSDIVSI